MVTRVAARVVTRMVARVTARDLTFVMARVAAHVVGPAGLSWRCVGSKLPLVVRSRGATDELLAYRVELLNSTVIAVDVASVYAV